MNRLTILLAVTDRASSVTELVEATGLGQTLVSPTVFGRTELDGVLRSAFIRGAEPRR